MTQNQAVLLKLVRRILNDAGLLPATVRPALAYGDKPSVLVRVERENHPELLRYIAAWIGLLTRQDRTIVFHPKTPTHTLYVYSGPKLDTLANLLEQAGEHYVYDTHAQHIYCLVPVPAFEPVREYRGTAETLSGRDDYRRAIDRAERVRLARIAAPGAINEAIVRVPVPQPVKQNVYPSFILPG